MPNFHSLFDKKTQPGVYWLDKDIALADIQQQAQHAGLMFYHLDGTTFRDKTQFLNQIALMLHFPTYFGHNWDALEDCLTDLSWQDTAGYVILYNHTELFQEYAKDDFDTALDIFRAATEFWRGHGRATWVLLLSRNLITEIKRLG